jgi:hypothetical protein
MSKLLEALAGGAFGINLNANDYFGPAADCVHLSSNDFAWALPFIDKWGEVGIQAVMFYIRKGRYWRRVPSAELNCALAELEALAPAVDEESN